MTMPKPKGKGVIAGYSGHVPHERDFVGGSFRNVQWGSVQRGAGTIHATVDLDGDGSADNFEGIVGGRSYGDGMANIATECDEDAAVKLALAQMSAMQRALVDKDGDGKLTLAELKKDGWTAGGRDLKR